jgi:hypothetical protein
LEKSIELKQKNIVCPYDEFLYENIEALLHASGYATDRREIQRLLLEKNKAQPKRLIEVIIGE